MKILYNLDCQIKLGEDTIKVFFITESGSQAKRGPDFSKVRKEAAQKQAYYRLVMIDIL